MTLFAQDLECPTHAYCDRLGVPLFATGDRQGVPILHIVTLWKVLDLHIVTLDMCIWTYHELYHNDTSLHTYNTNNQGWHR